MIRDPIVEDIRNTRGKIFDDCDEDLNTMLDRFQAQEKQDKLRIVSDISSHTKRDSPAA